MAVPANICVAWPSTVGSIPAGWSREVTLDSRYILGAAPGADTDLSTDRGATTHIHTSPSHTPTQNPHSHTFNAADGTGDSTKVSGTLGQIGPEDTHGHTSATSAATTPTNNGVAITVDPTSNDLAFTEVIWIKSDGTPTALPANCLAFFASDSLPSGWSRAQVDRYLKGAATGGAGGGTGGANTHTHTSPAHTHTQVAHAHTGTSGIEDVDVFGKGTGSDTIASVGHTHAVTLNSLNATNQSVTTTLSTSSHEPPFKKLNIITSGSPDLPTNIVALWLGTNAALAALSDWIRLTAMDSFWLKGATGGDVGTTGGGTSHTHTASDCQPVQDAHVHTITDPGSTGTTTAAPGVANNFAGPSHHHSPWTCDATTGTNNAVSVSIDPNTVNSALPKHRTVIYAQFTGSTPPPVRGGVYTSYSLNTFDIGSPEAEMLPEAAHRFAAGDLRYGRG